MCAHVRFLERVGGGESPEGVLSSFNAWLCLCDRVGVTVIDALRNGAVANGP